MIALSSTVLEWYQQQHQKVPQIFAKVADRQYKITIHQIVNLNAGLKLHGDRVSNTLSLLYMVRKRGALTPGYLEKMRGDHQVGAWRVLRSWQRAKNRGKR